MGPKDSLTVTQTVTDTAPEGSTDPVQELRVDRSGDLAIDGRNGRAWAIMMDADRAPEITIDGPLSRVAGGEMRLPFTARDDFAVIGGTARIELDLGVVDRRYGLAAEPERREDITFPIPLTLTGDRAEFTEVLAENFSLHPWANLPVRISLSAEDDLGQIGLSLPFEMELPGRRFFNPIASAIIEQRRDSSVDHDQRQPRRYDPARDHQPARRHVHQRDGVSAADDLNAASARRAGRGQLVGASAR